MMKYIYSLAAILLVAGCTDSGQSGHTPLLGTTWNLVELNNSKIQHPGPQVPHLRFETDKVTGNDGCNNFFGAYTLDGNKLKFGMLASTRMACPQINDLDIEFNKVISITTSYSISGRKLELFEEGKLLASFLAAEQG
ncbi:MAG: META domain-containing protein [Gammaproteobacteria bacterium]|nr:META domain-containing protein [Gammaproteobacteria bacterium]